MESEESCSFPHTACCSDDEMLGGLNHVAEIDSCKAGIGANLPFSLTLFERADGQCSA